ncbi:amino acid ABC transporter permease [Peptostreptococcus stomatis]|uniref:ABC transporter, permease protein n=1 Tax=Peptostreptococcus stomatis DSM 17678 TaxID=596315 RepID=E0E4S1_9FIRM|nr:amino acid ABC transporter permease [Peptostreptococcus stomatis]EFM64137.1 ABC transporter, permease protein [Peptostreptococcus stomatis DSM 17678]MBL6465875.1 amino acid ABC transporter permease [Peptostreptococcus stomatis]
MDFSFINDYYLSYIQGAGVTILISFMALLFGFIVGLVACVCKISNKSVLKWIANVYIEVIRDTPLLVQVMIMAYGFPMILGVKYPTMFGYDDTFTAAVMAMILNSGAYIAEILRSGISSVDKGQMEASRSLGLTYLQSMRYIIVPQAVKNILPALANEFISLVKESAIVAFVGVTDIMFVAISVKNSTYNGFGPYLFAALIYFVITFTLSKLVGLLEKKMTVER